MIIMVKTFLLLLYSEMIDVSEHLIVVLSLDCHLFTGLVIV